MFGVEEMFALTIGSEISRGLGKGRNQPASPGDGFFLRYGAGVPPASGAAM